MRSLPAPRTLLLSVVTALLLSVSATEILADNWAQWRGPTGNSICRESDVPVRWSRTENVAWRFPLPGPAGATPAVWDDRIFLTSIDGSELVLICVSTGGEELWRRTIGDGNKDARGDEGNSASPSPCTDGKYVWSMMATGEIGCFDFDGNEIWKLDLQERYGKFKIQFGMTSTPILHGDNLYFQCIHGDYRGETKEAFLVALEKRTGKEVWKQDRLSDAYGENEHSYASPVIYDDGELRLLITHGGDYVMAHDLDDGREVWRCGGLNPQDDPNKDYHKTLRFVASPTAVSGMIVVPTAKNGPVISIRPNFTGDITENKSAYHWTRARNTPDVPSPLIHDGLVYLCRENGNLICLEADTGNELYEQRTNRVRHRASPLFADGHVYLSGRDGKVTVVKTGRKFEIVAQNDLEESLSASPAVSNGTLYLRTFDALWAIRQ